MLAARLKAKSVSNHTFFEKTQESHSGYPCTNPKCIRGFLTRRGLREHLRRNECQSGTQRFRKSTRAMPTDRVVDRLDTIKNHVAKTLASTTICSLSDTVVIDKYDGKVCVNFC